MRRPNPLAAPLPLTPRAREIVTLAADGLSNRQIAEQLVVSVCAVEGHLYRACAKLGTSDRTELAALVPRLRAPTRPIRVVAYSHHHAPQCAPSSVAGNHQPEESAMANSVSDITLHCGKTFDDAGATWVSRVDHGPVLEVGNLALLAISGAIQLLQERLEPDQPREVDDPHVAAHRRYGRSDSSWR